MPEIIRQIPDEIQLQIAEDEGMIDRSQLPDKNGEIWMVHDIKYQIFQDQTSEWEGMVSKTK